MSIGIPGDLADALDRVAGSTPELRRAWAEVSDGYRAGRPTPGGDQFTDDHARAYAIGRAPATAAALAAVIGAVVERRPDWAPATMLDVGAGLGTASWVAMASVPTLRSVQLFERSPAMIRLGRELAADAEGSHGRLAGRDWHQSDVAAIGEHRADLVVAAYVLSELADGTWAGAVDAWWAATDGDLVIVDTGTPAGFERLRAARVQLIEGGAAVVAPCPNDGPCPIAGSDWCHFAVRLARTDAHRSLKGAELSFEDEKFAYLVASRGPVNRPAGRLVRHPQSRSGHIRLRVCHDEAITDDVVARSRKDAYRWARRAEWGDAVPPDVIG